MVPTHRGAGGEKKKRGGEEPARPLPPAAALWTARARGWPVGVSGAEGRRRGGGGVVRVSVHRSPLTALAVDGYARFAVLKGPSSRTHRACVQ